MNTNEFRETATVALETFWKVQRKWKERCWPDYVKGWKCLGPYSHDQNRYAGNLRVALEDNDLPTFGPEDLGAQVLTKHNVWKAYYMTVRHTELMLYMLHLKGIKED